jgi:hypothetical protein
MSFNARTVILALFSTAAIYFWRKQRAGVNEQSVRSPKPGINGSATIDHETARKRRFVAVEK